jgi:hypothetical protein
MSQVSIYSLIQRLWESGLNDPFTPEALLTVFSNVLAHRTVKRAGLSMVCCGLDGAFGGRWNANHAAQIEN